MERKERERARHVRPRKEGRGTGWDFERRVSSRLQVVSLAQDSIESGFRDFSWSEFVVLPIGKIVVSSSTKKNFFLRRCLKKVWKVSRGIIILEVLPKSSENKWGAVNWSSLGRFPSDAWPILMSHGLKIDFSKKVRNTRARQATVEAKKCLRLQAYTWMSSDCPTGLRVTYEISELTDN